MTDTIRVNIKEAQYDVYMGRPSIWGNPFIIGRHGTREEVIKKYKEYLLNDPLLMSEIMSLRGKVLGCFCKTNEACHVDVIIEVIEALEKGDIKTGTAKDSNPKYEDMPLGFGRKYPPTTLIADLPNKYLLWLLDQSWFEQTRFKKRRDMVKMEMDYREKHNIEIVDE